MLRALAAAVLLAAPGIAAAQPSEPTAEPWGSLATTYDVIGLPNNTGDYAGYGLRLDIDVYARSPWLTGFALGTDRESTATGPDGAMLRDKRGFLYVAYDAYHQARYDLRGTLGAGLVYTSFKTWGTFEGVSAAMETTQLTPIGEASLTFSIEVAPRLAIGFGPVVTIYDHQTFQALLQGTIVRDMQMMAAVTVRWRLD